MTQDDIKTRLAEIIDGKSPEYAADLIVREFSVTLGWQPISTAPKDGNVVLVCRDMGEPWGWVMGSAHWVDIGGIAGWISRGLADPPGELGLGHPTRWQPLPTPPAADQGEIQTGEQE